MYRQSKGQLRLASCTQAVYVARRISTRNAGNYFDYGWRLKVTVQDVRGEWRLPPSRSGFASLFNTVLENHSHLEPDSLKTDFKSFDKLITLLTHHSYEDVETYIIRDISFCVAADEIIN